MTKNPIKWYIKARGDYDFDSTRANYNTERYPVELDLSIDEWTTKRGWTRRIVRCTAYLPHREHHYESDCLSDVPYLSDTFGTRRGDKVTSQTTSPTRAEQIHHTVSVVRSLVRGSSPRYFETEQALREALEDDPEDGESFLDARHRNPNDDP